MSHLYDSPNKMKVKKALPISKICFQNEVSPFQYLKSHRSQFMCSINSDRIPNIQLRHGKKSTIKDNKIKSNQQSSLRKVNIQLLDINKQLCKQVEEQKTKVKILQEEILTQRTNQSARKSSDLAKLRVKMTILKRLINLSLGTNLERMLKAKNTKKFSQFQNELADLFGLDLQQVLQFLKQKDQQVHFKKKSTFLESDRQSKQIDPLVAQMIQQLTVQNDLQGQMPVLSKLLQRMDDQAKNQLINIYKQRNKLVTEISKLKQFLQTLESKKNFKQVFLIDAGVSNDIADRQLSIKLRQSIETITKLNYIDPTLNRNLQNCIQQLEQLRAKILSEKNLFQLNKDIFEESVYEKIKYIFHLHTRIQTFLIDMVGGLSNSVKLSDSQIKISQKNIQILTNYTSETEILFKQVKLYTAQKKATMMRKKNQLLSTSGEQCGQCKSLKQKLKNFIYSLTQDFDSLTNRFKSQLQKYLKIRPQSTKYFL